MSLADAAAFAVAAWALDEASGTRFDQVGSSDLTDINTVGSNTGKLDTAADFEASNSEALTVPDNADLSMGDIDFMVRFWVKVESLTAAHEIIVKGDLFGYDYRLVVGGVGLIWSVVDGSGNEPQASHATLTPGTWYLIHCWHDSSGNEIGICVNAGTAVVTSHSTGVRDSNGPFNLGARYHSGIGVFNPFDGLIDDVVVLKNYILDADERTEDYNGGDGIAFADWAGGGPAEYSLTADAGAYSLSGQAANLLAGRKLTAADGAYALTGNDASFVTASLPAASSTPFHRPFARPFRSAF